MLTINELGVNKCQNYDVAGVATKMSASETLSLNFMNNTLPWIALLIGLVVGGLVMAFVTGRVKSEVIEEYDQTDSISDDAADLLEVLSTAAVVLNPQNLAVRVTQDALSYGLIRERSLIHDELEQLVNKARQSGKVEPMEVELELGLRRNLAYFNARAVRVGDSNVLLILEDRTESKRLDDTRRDFIANISHELKTPIGAVSLLSEAIDNAKDDPVAVDKFNQQLRREASRLAQLVKDVIQLSRFQSADALANADLVDLSTVVADAVDRNQFTASQRNVKLNWDASETAYVYGDAEMLTVAVKNLIENAVVYSDEGSRVGVGVKVEQDVASISVTDQGVGISEEDQKRIFERFYRVDQSRSRETGGTGLGLSIVRQVANSHRGEIRVFSKAGVGSTFSLRLPSANTQVVAADTERIAG